MMYLNPLTANLVTTTGASAAADSGGSGSGSGTNSSDPLSGSDTMFLQLLTTQLENQTPLDPVDPNQFTTELVQFNMLDELTQIQQLLQQAVISPAASGSASSSTQGAK
jgi:flagellar basal-body rod modification protein FlgD